MTPAEIVELARRFHDEYERNAPNFGYTTRDDTRAFDITTPNGQLMVAVVQAVIVPAIRAAVAHERERAAKVCEKNSEEAIAQQSGPTDDLTNILLRHHASQAFSCAAAIRRGE